MHFFLNLHLYYLFQVCWIKLFFHCIAFMSLFWWSKEQQCVDVKWTKFLVSVWFAFLTFFYANVWCQFQNQGACWDVETTICKPFVRLQLCSLCEHPDLPNTVVAWLNQWCEFEVGLEQGSATFNVKRDTLVPFPQNKIHVEPQNIWCPNKDNTAYS